MGGGVDAGGEAADDGESRAAQRGGEGRGVRLALFRRVAAADDREGGAVEQADIAFRVEQRRRIGDRQQGTRIVGVGEGQDMVARLRRPFERGLDFIGAVVCRQALGEPTAERGAQGGGRGGEYRLRTAECLEEPALRFAADAGNQRQPQPGGELLLGQFTQGLLTRSPGRTGRDASTIRP